MSTVDGWAAWPIRAPPILDQPHLGHRNHLCDLANRGEMSLDQMKALVRDPKFICKKCGRAANKEENLCDPVPL
jgi:hypothetical protein